jgi:hypothetical protein
MNRIWGGLLLLTAGCVGDPFVTVAEATLDGAPISVLAPDGGEIPSQEASMPDAGADVRRFALHDPDAGAAEDAPTGDVAVADVGPVGDSGSTIDARPPPIDAAPEAAPVEASCAPVTHDDGFGEHWADCAPLGTYNEAEAMAACASYATATGADAGACHLSETACSGGTQSYVCHVQCWGFSAPVAGSAGVPSYCSGPTQSTWR